MIIQASLPILPRFEARPERAWVERVHRLAEHLAREQPELAASAPYRSLVPTKLEDAPALHLDDLAGIPLVDGSHDLAFLEDRARLRAVDGDWIATCSAADETFERYCEEELGLGAATWLRPHAVRNPLSVASACWEDRAVRGTLVRALRANELFYVHPYRGSLSVWVLAALLRRTSRRPVEVIAPPPGLTRAVNDKLWFTRVAKRLFGARAVPRAAEAYSFSTLALLARSMARETRTLVVKVPDSAGGRGNLCLDAGPFRRGTAGSARARLKELLRPLDWHGERPLLIGCWETEALSSPSVQLWIPPEPQGHPLVEGIFEQIVEDARWTGSRRTHWPDRIARELVDQSWLLARLFQSLGYVGRCSFDLLLMGPRRESSRAVFLECNGRWGGASLPMTLVNRLLGPGVEQPYATRLCCAEGLRAVRFQDVLEHFAADLFDARSGTGRLVFFSPAGLQARGGIDVLAFADTWEQAARAVEAEIPARLAELVASRG